MGFYIGNFNNSTPHNRRWILSYKDFELSKQAVATYEWIEFGRKNGKVFLYAQPKELKNIQGIQPDQVCVAWKHEDSSHMITNDSLFLIKSSDISVDNHPQLIKNVRF